MFVVAPLTLYVMVRAKAAPLRSSKSTLAPDDDNVTMFRLWCAHLGGRSPRSQDTLVLDDVSSEATLGSVVDRFAVVKYRDT